MRARIAHGRARVKLGVSPLAGYAVAVKAHLLLADALVVTARAVGRVLPKRVMKGIEDRVFYAIFQRTRVENDAYGWRPDVPPGGGSPPKG
jgi:hypothetical protein